MWIPTQDNALMHSAKGSKWAKHKYIAIKNGRYIYPKTASATEFLNPGLLPAAYRAFKAGKRVNDQMRDMTKVNAKSSSLAESLGAESVYSHNTHSTVKKAHGGKSGHANIKTIKPFDGYWDRRYKKTDLRSSLNKNIANADTKREIAENEKKKKRLAQDAANRAAVNKKRAKILKDTVEPYQSKGKKLTQKYKYKHRQRNKEITAANKKNARVNRSAVNVASSKKVMKQNSKNRAWWEKALNTFDYYKNKVAHKILPRKKAASTGPTVMQTLQDTARNKYLKTKPKKKQKKKNYLG